MTETQLFQQLHDTPCGQVHIAIVGILVRANFLMYLRNRAAMLLGGALPYRTYADISPRACIWQPADKPSRLRIHLQRSASSCPA